MTVPKLNIQSKARRRHNSFALTYISFLDALVYFRLSYLHFKGTSNKMCVVPMVILLAWERVTFRSMGYVDDDKG